MKSLQGKTAIVTGASRGIGRAIAGRLALDGAQVLLVARSAADLDAQCAQLRSAGATATSFCADLCEPDAAAALRGEFLRQHRSIDILVNCAGATRVGDFLEFSEAAWADGFALKFHAARRLCAAFWGDLCASTGSVVNIVGTAARSPSMDYCLGGAVNAALLAFTKALAQRGIRDGVQVNAVNPGPVRTARQAANIARVAAEHQLSTDAAVVELARQFGMSRIGEPEDIAALVAFVVSPAARWLQGSLIDMDGGQTKSI